MNIGQKQNKNLFPTSVYTFTAEELNQIVDELQHIITSAGLTKDASDTTQVLQAMRLLLSGTFESLIGVYVPYGGDILPEGWLWCDGSALLRADYTKLFARIGTQFGEGDGSTTFNIPDFTGGRFIEGSDQNGIYKNAGLPNIKGTLYSVYTSRRPGEGGESATGAFGVYSSDDMTRDGGGSASDAEYGITFDASRSNSIYSDLISTVQPKSLTSRWIIKY